MRQGFPIARAGRRVGLFGGSFDPAHEGHVLVTREALRRFALDEVWWLVSPGNPLKTRGPASLDRRVAHAREVMQHPRVQVLDIEARLGTRYTFETLQAIDTIYPGVRFVWLMGADNLSEFHRWERWRSIMARMPVGVMARPGQRISARMSRAARIFDTNRISAKKSHLLADLEPPAWCFVNVPMSDASSTRIRQSGAWPAV